MYKWVTDGNWTIRELDYKGGGLLERTHCNRKATPSHRSCCLIDAVYMILLELNQVQVTVFAGV